MPENKELVTEDLKSLPKYLKRQKCLDELREIIWKIGPFSVNRNALAKKYKLEWQTVDKWYTNIIKDCPREKIENIKFMGEATIRTAMSHCERIMADPKTTPKLRLEAISKINETLRNYNDFLENFNMKPRIAQEISLTGSFEVDKLLKIAQESKDRKMINITEVQNVEVAK